MEYMMNVKIYGIKRYMGVLNDDLKENMEAMMIVKIKGLKEGLAKQLEERLPSGDKVIQENHDEGKNNMNYDFKDSNVGFKKHHIPKIDMRKFDGKDLITWILQMEQYFDIHNVKNTQKVQIATLYLKPNRYIWY